jgi:hypothetical protein
MVSRWCLDAVNELKYMNYLTILQQSWFIFSFEVFLVYLVQAISVSGNLFSFHSKKSLSRLKVGFIEATRRLQADFKSTSIRLQVGFKYALSRH